MNSPTSPKKSLTTWGATVVDQNNASRIDAYMPGQEAANYPQRPGKLGAAYNEGLGGEDWAQA